MKSRVNKKALTCWVDRPTHVMVKLAAAKAGISMQELLQEAAARECQRLGKRKGRKAAVA